MDRQPVQIRLASRDDAEAISALPVASYTVGDGPNALEPDHHLDSYVATDSDGTVVASVTVRRPGAASSDWVGPGELGIQRLAVVDTPHGAAAAAALMLRCFDVARADRLDRLVTYTPLDVTVEPADSAELGFRRLPWRDRVTPQGDAIRALALDLAPVVVRPALPHETVRAGEVTLAGYVADGVVDPTHGYAARLADATSRAEAATLLVAVDSGGTVVGTVTFCRPGSAYAELSGSGEAEFRMLAVDPAARGSGVGAALVHACLDRAGAAGDHTLVLSTLAKMRAAARLYQRLGFTADPSRDWSPEPGIRLLAYQRPVLPLTR